jgi:ACS family allantoate permease-like MFS transporter
MEVNINQDIDIQNDEKVPTPIVIVDEEEKDILRKIDAQ